CLIADCEAYHVKRRWPNGRAQEPSHNPNDLRLTSNPAVVRRPGLPLGHGAAMPPFAVQPEASSKIVELACGRDGPDQPRKCPDTQRAVRGIREALAAGAAAERPWAQGSELHQYRRWYPAGVVTLYQFERRQRPPRRHA